MNPENQPLQNQPPQPAQPVTPPSQPAEPELQVNNPLSSMQPGERNIAEITRHPFGMFVTYISAAVLLLIAAVIAFVVVPMAAPNDSRTQLLTYATLGFMVFALLVIGFVFVANKVYWGNRWILTSDSLTQVLQLSLFDKQSSQLSLGNLEDVTAAQDGIIPHMLNFGVLRVETAGERSKFVFNYCPNPNYYAQQILQAREAFEQGRRGEDNPQRLYREQGAYAQADPGVNINTQQ
ncbi:MAG TPA: hypothetical protein VFN56_02050 [Candidatus Saccharimonadales bacterium]|nr:hypothetical protein [Candidatus Saccharimonadales bacterium]